MTKIIFLVTISLSSVSPNGILCWADWAEWKRIILLAVMVMLVVVDVVGSCRLFLGLGYQIPTHMIYGHLDGLFLVFICPIVNIKIIINDISNDITVPPYIENPFSWQKATTMQPRYIDSQWQKAGRLLTTCHQEHTGRLLNATMLSSRWPM